MDDHKISVLVVDDDESVTASIALLLKRQGYEVFKASNPEDALSIIECTRIQLVIQDMNFSRETSGEEGLQLLQSIKKTHPSLPVILITAWGSISLAVAGLKQGAADFLTKPWDNKQLLVVVETALALNEKQITRINSRKQLPPDANFDAIIGEDPNLIAILATIARVAKTNAPVLILGESGTGKELIADAIHQYSSRVAGPLVKVNLGGMNSALFESEMFGHVKGAFTDAKQDRIGRFQLADKGTIFLDEIGDLDPASQVKLLRVLQDQTFQIVGSSETRRTDIRVISATNRNLTELVKDNRFREDLLYRLNLITIEIPPLRERVKDIRLIAQHHLKQIERRYQLPKLNIDEAGLVWLEHQQWPGNIRQLTQSIERVVLMSGNHALSRVDFEQHLSEQCEGLDTDKSLPIGMLTLDEMERLMIEKSLEAYAGNITKVADALGISRAALYRRMEKFGLTTESARDLKN